MPRIKPLTRKNAGIFTKLAYTYAARRYGAMPEPFAVMAHHRGITMAGGLHEMLAEQVSKALPANVRELAVYRTAVRLGCEWCIDFGTMLQKHAGLDIDRLKHIDDYAKSPLYTPEERLAIAYADAMTTSPVTVTDEQVAELERAFGTKGVVELTYQIALENMRARMNSALGVTAQGFASGDACRVP